MYAHLYALQILEAQYCSSGAKYFSAIVLRYNVSLGPRFHKVEKAAWLISPSGWPISASPSLGLQVYATIHDILLLSCGTNSTMPARMASNLLTKFSSNPLKIIL